MWELFNDFRHLVNIGKANPILCPDCQSWLVTRLNVSDDDVWLWCPECGTMFKPGLDVIDKVRTVVSEHNGNNQGL